ncbi:Sua5/YciO/YrdC/YwlC family protein [bacterium]|nr:Sua5/YciO/YrdC/YwlC family protein [bacterium]
MKIIKLNDQISEKQIIDIVVDYLFNGKIIVLPTDTIYGFHCLSSDNEAINKIFKIKKKKINNPLINLVSSIDMVKNLAEVNEKQEEYLKKTWIKQAQPTTIILERKIKVMDDMFNFALGISVRLPNFDFLIKMIDKLKIPIVSTSLNKSGEAIISNIADLGEYFNLDEIDLAVDAGGVKSKASRLIDVRDINNIKVLRQ